MYRRELLRKDFSILTLFISAIQIELFFGFQCRARFRAILPEKSRQILALRYEEDASMERVAEAIESTAGAVRVILFRIRNLLAECMNSELARTTP